MTPSSPERIPATIIIEETLTDRTWHGRLPNGKQILAFCRPRSARPTLTVGDKIDVWMTVEDFSRGEIR